MDSPCIDASNLSATDIGSKPFTFVIQIKDILSQLQYNYMVAILLCSSILLGYQLINMFVKRTPERVVFFKWLDAVPTVPALFLFVLSLAYFTGYGATNGVSILT